jgi:hypothetical protein
MKNISLTTQEWNHLVSVMQLDSMTGDKQSEKLYQKLIKEEENEKTHPPVVVHRDWWN